MVGQLLLMLVSVGELKFVYSSLIFVNIKVTINESTKIITVDNSLSTRHY